MPRLGSRSLPCGRRLLSLALGLLLVLPLLAADPAMAAKKKKSSRARTPISATDPAKDAALVIDGSNGKVLYARNEMAERHPASLTKMMTLYLLFDALRHGKLSMETPLPVSRHASQQKPTKLYLKPGQTITVDEAIRAIVIRSANDVASVIAEALGGTESHFAVMMTERARKLGMMDTNFHNASGLPDPLQISTAHDLAILGRHLAYDFPEYYSYFALEGFKYKGSWFPTHNNLIGKYEGADGIKTGYTGASGFNLVSSVVRGHTHLIAVVLGGRTAVRRDREMERLLDQTFAKIDTNPTLVAQINVPWHKGEATAGPVLASLTPALASARPQQHYQDLSGIPAVIQAADEDAAENARAPDERYVPAPVARPATAVAAAGPAMPLVPAIRPTPRPGGQEAAPVRLAMAGPAAAPPQSPAQAAPVRVANVPVPKMRPSVDPDADEGEGDADPPSQSSKNWTIQIGAYADRALASAQLASYADKANDVLARAKKIIDPVQSSNGHTLYRARFGLFAEREAREVCSRLTQRGQTCFAAVQTR
ncbi:MAG: D-alanyl-D-alanine carboxypeptidase [Alphaproteobacteria bacterium]|nr:D-alanyl-D-alanine carboxypeptidase [Alphaproteobacteria bacterium]